MKEAIKQSIDLSVERRRYYSEDCSLTICPECNSPLIEEGCSILLAAKSDTAEGEFMTSLSGSHFCNKCPVVVFDSDKVEKAATLGMKGGNNLRYIIRGIIDLNSIPKEKKHLEIGIDENPVPLVQFLPELNTTTIVADKKIGRNEPCPCGSGKKHKKCCG